MPVRILSRDDVERSLGMTDAIQAMASAFAQVSDGRAVMPTRIGVETPSGFTLTMPGYLGEEAALAIKVVSVFEGNSAKGLPAINALVLVLDATTGVPRAVMDGTHLTALRTGAASGLATDLLARPGAEVVAVFGAGVQARTQLQAVRAVREIREVRILARSPESAEAFAAEVEGVSVRAYSEAAEAIAGAHIVCAATTSRIPVLAGDAVEPGTHVNGVGSFTPGMIEFDADLLVRAKVVVDEREAAVAEAGELIAARDAGLFDPEEDIHAELGELVLGLREGRTSPDEITFFKSVGNAAQDVAVAHRVLAHAESHGIGTLVEF